ncbi:MAG: hypothetical protein RMJ53_05510 [Chitinophagales bacterium]|nr:hypothetical protein [Chitinophagales bacterium]
MYIQPGALLYVGDDPDNGEFGDLVIRGDSTVPGQGVIYNDGVIALTGNLFSGDTVNGISYGNPKFDTVKGVFYSVPPSVIKERMVVFRGDDNNQVIKGYLDQPEASFFNLGIDKDPSQIGASVVLGSNVRVRGSLIWNPNQSGITASTYDQSGSIAMTDYLSGGGYGRIKTYRNNKDYELYISNPDTASIVNYSTFSINTSDALKIVENRGVQGVGLGGLSREIGFTSKYYAFPVGTNLRGNNGVLLNFSSLPPSGSRKVRGMFVNVNGSVGSVNYALYATSYPCNGGFPHWFEFNTLLNDHGYWSFDADQNNLNHYKYVIYTFPNGLSTSEYDLLMSGNNMRVLKYNASVVDTPNGDWSPWVGGIGNDTQNLINYTFFDTSVACYNNPFNGIPGGEYNDFSHFGIGGSGSSSLPIELLTLKAYPVKNEFIRVDWVTASEINNENFSFIVARTGLISLKSGRLKAKVPPRNSVSTISMIKMYCQTSLIIIV